MLGRWAAAAWLLPLLLLTAPQPTEAAGPEVGKWKRFETAYANPTYIGNPFDTYVYAVFTHVATQRYVVQIGFYAGNDTWKIFFMPDELGDWIFTTFSDDPELDGHTGSLECVPSGLPGRLIADGNKLKLEDSGEYVAPVMLMVREWFKSTPTDQGVGEFIEWADEVAGARIIGTNLVYFNQPQDAIPFIDGQEPDVFNIPMWDRMNDHYDAMRDRGIGFYIMFYSDDGESPNNHGILEGTYEEFRLFAYAIARFGAYPIVVWDTGIDIIETRSLEWMEGFAEYFNFVDPYGHLVGNRFCCGSGGIDPVAGTVTSDGYRGVLPDYSFSFFIGRMLSRSKPTLFTDKWREDYDSIGVSLDWTQRQIREAVWEGSLTGTGGYIVSGDTDSGFLQADYATDFLGAVDMGHRTRFLRNHLNFFGRLEPRTDLLVSGAAALSADAGREYVAYMRVGGPLEVDLSDASGPLRKSWYNPRTGTFTDGETIAGGGVVALNAPDTDDWVLLIQQNSIVPGSPLAGRVALAALLFALGQRGFARRARRESGPVAPHKRH